MKLSREVSCYFYNKFDYFAIFFIQIVTKRRQKKRKSKNKFFWFFSENFFFIVLISVQNISIRGPQPATRGPHAVLETHPYGPTSNFFKFFCLSFDVDCKEIPLQLQMELIDLLCSEDLKSKFLACYICLALRIVVNSCSPKWNVLRLCCVGNCLIITCLMCSFCQLLHLTLILHLSVWLQTTSDVSALGTRAPCSWVLARLSDIRARWCFKVTD